jgi:hypothetical protein|tara:strand:- start:112 stop:309 length:198 start_codon:yes stop_codon:yes gene_type:complete
MSTDFTNWKCDDLTTEEKEAERVAYAKMQEQMAREYDAIPNRTNAHDVNDALMENPSLWDDLENL